MTRFISGIRPVGVDFFDSAMKKVSMSVERSAAFIFKSGYFLTIALPTALFASATSSLSFTNISKRWLTEGTTMTLSVLSAIFSSNRCPTRFPGARPDSFRPAWVPSRPVLSPLSGLQQHWDAVVVAPLDSHQCPLPRNDQQSGGQQHTRLQEADRQADSCDELYGWQCAMRPRRSVGNSTLERASIGSLA